MNYKLTHIWRVSLVEEGTNVWLAGQAACMGLYLVGTFFVINHVRRVIGGN